MIDRGPAEILSQNLPAGTEKNYGTPQDDQCLGRDLN
jgi:hypothetical protein